MAPRKTKALTTVDGVKRDLAELPAHLSRSALAGSALAIARELDAADTSATARASCARSLVQVMAGLRELAPAQQQTDELDELQARRAAHAR